MNEDKDIFEKIYEKPEAGWTKHVPPTELIDLIKNGKIKPCKVIDVGCGEGYYSIYLASLGFDVMGIDLSERAIGFAQKNAEKAKVNVRFVTGDLRSVQKFEETFDFIFEWSVLHHIMPDDRNVYIENINMLLIDDGKYLATCFNEANININKDDDKYKISPIGTKLYYSSELELKNLYQQYFNILEAKLIKFEGPPGLVHTYNYFFMQKLGN